MKRIHILKAALCLLLTVSLLVGTLPASLSGVIPARAETGTKSTNSDAAGGWRYRVCEDGNIELLGHEDASVETLSLPQSLDGRWVVRLSAGAFSENAELRSVDIPASIGEIPDSAFPNNRGLEIRGYNGTAAMRFAKGRGFTFENRSRFDLFDDVLDLSEMKGAQWSLSGSTLTVGMPYALQVKQETKVFLPANANYPQGIAAAVKSVGFSGDSLTAKIDMLDFARSVRTYSVENEPMYVDYDNIRLLCEGVQLDWRSSRGRKLQSKEDDFPIRIPDFIISLDFSETIAIEGKVGYKADIHVTAEYETPVIKKATFLIDGELSSEVTVKQKHEISRTGEKTIKFEKPAKKNFAKVPVASASGIITAYLVFAVEIAVDGAVTVTQTLNHYSKITYENKSARHEWRHPPKDQINLSTQVSGYAKYAISMTFEIGFPAVIRPLKNVSVKFAEIEVGARLEFEAKQAWTASAGAEFDFDDTNGSGYCFDVNGGLRFTVDVRIGLLNSRENGGNGWLEKLLKDLCLDIQWIDLTCYEKNLIDVPLPIFKGHWEGSLAQWVDKCTREDVPPIFNATFNFMYDNRIETVSAVQGEPFEEPENVHREGYTFHSWYTNAGLTHPWVPELPANEDIVLYARWTKNEDGQTDPGEGDPEDPQQQESGTITGTGYKLGYGPYRMSLDNDDPHNVKMGWGVWLKEGNPTHVTIPAYVEGHRVKMVSGFQNCTSLESITIPYGVEEIGGLGVGVYYSGFRGCTKLSRISIPSSVKLIGEGAFYDCTSLTHVELPSALRCIGYDAFRNSGIKEVTLGGKLEDIGSNAFSGCTKLEKVVVCEGLESFYAGGWFLGYDIGVFSGCTSLKTVRLPSTFKVINDFAFSGCTSLTDVTIHEGLREIGDGAFDGCGSLTDIKLPDSVQRIGTHAFARCGLKSIVLPRSLQELGANGTFGGGCNFWGCENLVSVEMFDGLPEIPTNAFKNCTRLQSIKIPGSVKTIYNGAFENTGLVEIEIPSTVVTLYGDAFKGCANLMHFETPENVDVVGNLDFRGCISLEEVNIPYSSGCVAENFTGGYDNDYRTSLVRVRLPQNTTRIGCDAFKNCVDLTEITIPNTVTEICSGAFQNCTSLSNVILPVGLETIDRYAFENCEKLQSIRLPDSVHSMDNLAFMNCSGLKSFEFSKSLKSIDYFYAAMEYESVTVWDSMEELGSAHLYSKVAYVESMDGYPANWFREKYPDTRLILIGTEDPVITFDPMGGECETTSTTVLWGDPVVAPTDPVQDGSDFLGWFIDYGTQIPWDFDAAVTSDMTLYAGWGIRESSFEYHVSDGGAIITGYMGNVHALIIPRQLDGYTVVGLDYGAIPSSVYTLSLPASILIISADAFVFARGLYAISMEGNNAAGYRSSNGVLYKNDELICYPMQHTGETYAIPAGTRLISRHAFKEVDRLKRLEIPASVQRLEEYAVTDCVNLEEAAFAADVLEIGTGNFIGCAQSFHIVGPEGATTLEEYMEAEDLEYNMYYIVLMMNNEVVALVPTRAGYEVDLPVLDDTETKVFIGWSTDQAGSQIWTNETMPARDLVLFAIMANEFDYEVLEDNTARLTRYNGCKNEVLVPETIDEYDVKEIADDCFPDTNVTLVGEKGSFVEDYAVEHGMAFRAILHTVSFDTNGGKPIASLQLEATTLLAPVLPVPVKEGYGKYSWYLNNYEYVGEETTMPPRDIMMVARWDTEYYDEEEGEWIQYEGVDVPFTFEMVQGGVAITGYTGEESTATVPATINGDPVVAIADRAFAEIRVLTGLTLPEGLTRIGDSAFEGSSIVEVTMPGVSQLGDNAFARSMVCAVELPAVVEIGDNAFCECGSLNAVSLGGSLNKMGKYAFAQCQSLISIVLPDGLIALEKGVFKDCEWLEEVTLPTALETIDTLVFSDCKHLTQVNLGASVNDLEIGAFDSCNALQFIGVDSDNLYYSSLDGVLFNKSGNTLVYYPEGKTDTGYTVPDGVTLLGSESIKNRYLKTLTLGSDVQAIGDSAMSGCACLETLNLNAGLEEIGERAFAGCLGLREVVIPESVAALMPEAFTMTGLTSITIPEDTQVGRNTIPENNGLTIYGTAGSSAETYAIEHGIRFVDLSRDVPVAGISIPETLTLGTGESYRLTATLTPEDTTETAVTWRSSDSGVVWADAEGMLRARKSGIATVVAIAANGATASCEVTVPVTATYESFNPRKADFRIPEDVTSIYANTYEGIHAVSVVIPASCTYIGSRAFANCKSLQIVYFENGDNVTVADDFLDECPLAVVLAPAGSAMASWTRP